MKTIFAFFLCCFVVKANAQVWDSTYRPAGYSLKVELFKSYPDSKTDIVFLGNSITAGVDFNELLSDTRIRNRGISSDITFGVLERLQEVTAGKPAKVFILIGINDISRNVPDSFIISNYAKIIQRIKAASPSTKIYFHTLLPVNNEFKPLRNHFNKDEHILFVNTALKKLAEQEKVCLIDLHPHFLNKENKLDKAYTSDGLHLNAAGYKLWADILKKGKYLKN